VITFTNAPITGVPEPGTGWLFGLGLTVWTFLAKRNNLADIASRAFSTSRPSRRQRQSP